MSANFKVFLLIVLGVSASIFSFFSSQYFSSKLQNNQLLLNQVQQLSGQIQYIHLLSKDFIQNGNEASWHKVTDNIDFLDFNFIQNSVNTNNRWREDMLTLKASVDEFYQILSEIHDPAIQMQEEKRKLQSIGLSFSEEIEEKIIQPYRKEEGLQIYRGEPIDPFKIRIKETAYELIRQHYQQQLILLELLLNWNLEEYQRKKDTITSAFEKKQSQLNYLALLVGNEQDINTAIDSLNEKLQQLTDREKRIFGLFTRLSSLNYLLNAIGEELLSASNNLSTRIEVEIEKNNRLNITLNWILLAAILLGFGALGIMLASDIVRFVKSLKATQRSLKENIKELRLNIEARKEAEDAVRVSEEKYRSIFENTLEGLFQTTEEGNLISANPAFAKIFGYDSSEEMVEDVSKIQDQLYVNDIDREAMFELLYSQEVVTKFESQFKKKDGTVIIGSINAKMVHQNGNSSPHIEGTFRDITKMRLADEEKAKLEEQLRHSQKMEAIGSLAGGISHDFNNLLQAISGNMQLIMMNKSEDDPDYSKLQQIGKAVERANDIARRLLTFSRKIDTKITPTNVNEIILGTLEILKHSLPRMINIETNLAKEPHTVMTDPTQLDQVIMNLAANAADAMPDGGQLIIETENVLLDSQYQARHLDVREGRYVKITITDTGEGMDQKTKQHIFEPFFTTKEIGKGTGLGLSIVYGIIRSFKGHINCYSEEGIGTTFTIYLPASTESDREAGPEHKIDWDPVKGTETILVVDDEEMIRQLVEEMLSSFGYTTLLAESGESALEIINDGKHELDLVILDLNMPGMGGEKCLKEISFIAPELKVIVASGYGAHKFASDNPQHYGAQGFISKPYQLYEMLLTIRRVFDSN